MPPVPRGSSCRPLGPLVALLVCVAAYASSAAASPATVEDEMATAARRALRQFRRDTGTPATSLAVWPLQFDERLDDRAKPFPFERGAERVARFREQREEDVRLVRRLWLDAVGVDLLPRPLEKALVGALSESARVVGPERVERCLKSMHADAGYPQALARPERSQLFWMTAAPVVVRARVGIASQVARWDWCEERFLPVEMVQRTRVRFEFLDLEKAEVLGTYETDLLGGLVYEPHADILDVAATRTSDPDERPRVYDLHVRVRVTNMMGRVATVGFCMEGDTKQHRAMNMRWGPMDTVLEEFDVVFSDIVEPATVRRSRIDVRVYVAQGFGTRKQRRGPCEAQAAVEELTHTARRIR